MIRVLSFMIQAISTRHLLGHQYVILMVMPGSLDIEATLLKSWPREVPSWKWHIFCVSVSNDNFVYI